MNNLSFFHTDLKYRLLQRRQKVEMGELNVFDQIKELRVNQIVQADLGQK